MKKFITAIMCIIFLSFIYLTTYMYDTIEGSVARELFSIVLGIVFFILSVIIFPIREYDRHM